MRQVLANVSVLLPLCAVAGMPATVRAQDLASFAVLAGSTITNTGATVINGNIGVSPGSAITGFPPGVVLPPYAIYQNDAVAGQAQSDLTTAYNILAGRPATADLTGQNLGGLVLTPGVYNFADSSQLTGTLTLDAQGDPNAVFIFKIGSTLTTASNSRVELINGAQGGNVYFQVGSSATLGTDTDFTGKILALTSITLNTDADIECGSALARNGAVTLDSNTISVCTLAAATYSSQLDSTATVNERAVVAAIDAYVARGGLLPLAFQVLPGVLSPTELAAAMTQLSGEVGTGVAPAGIQAMHSFMSLVFDNAFREARGIPLEQAPPRGTVSVLGYAPGDVSRRGPFGALGGVHVAPAPPLWSVWAAAYGGHTNTDGNGVTGSHDRSSRTLGMAAGADYRATPDTKLGFALGGGATRFGLKHGQGSGTSDMFQAAIYSRTNFGSAYLTGALAYAWHDVAVSRTVSIGGSDTLMASFKAHNFAGQLETGYRFGWFVPYAAIGVQSFTTPSYSERAGDGVSLFALSFDRQTTIAARSQLGFRTEQAFKISDGVALHLRTRTAWAHDFSEDPYSDASFQALPASGFRVRGAAQSRDSLLFSAGAELALATGFSIAGLFETQVARGFQSYTGRGQIRYTW